MSKTNGNGCIHRVCCDTNESITTKAAYMAMEDALESEILAVTLLETHLDAERRIDLANYLYGKD